MGLIYELGIAAIFAAITEIVFKVIESEYTIDVKICKKKFNLSI